MNRKNPKLDPTLYYFCSIGKKPNAGKIRNCCVGRGCPLIATKRWKRSASKLVQITEAQSSDSPFA
jgi:hypothetical protein